MHNLLEGTPAHAGLSTLGIIALLGFVACVVTIAQKCVQAKDDDDDDNINSARSVNALHSGVGGSAMADTGSHVGGLNPNHHQRLKSDLSTQHEDFDSGTPSPRKVKLFKAPGLPYVPAAALICNFSLMAQVSWHFRMCVSLVLSTTVVKFKRFRIQVVHFYSSLMIKITSTFLKYSKALTTIVDILLLVFLFFVLLFQ